MANDGIERANDLEGIAIIGMSGRFPKADTINQYWTNLIEGRDCIDTVSVEAARKAGVSESLIQDPRYVRRGARINNPDIFDASFFGYSPREASILDPQHRLFLQCGWEAIESAGYDVSRLETCTGVFAGCGMNHYMLQNLVNNTNAITSINELQLLFGNDKDFLTTRLSYKLNLRGPSFDIQTACSTSLVAVHVACQNLLTYQCDTALAGGVFLYIPWWLGYTLADGDIRSPDGVCRPFDINANGTLFGEGAGVVVLKRLEEAVNDGDHIFAVIKGTAINNDGSVKAGYTAPSVDGQADVITMALESAGVKASEISYIEAHGTGTPLGDPVEISALTKAFRQYTDKKGFCGIGSVKASIGHLDAAAGIAGLIKTALSLYHKQIPPSLNYIEPNPLLDINNTPFFVVDKKTPWNVLQGSTRRAGVSSLGVGGTNAHVILEEAPQIKSSLSSKKYHLFPVAAKTPEALKKSSQNISEYIQQHSASNPADIAFTMQNGRKHFPFRQFVVATSPAEATNRLSTIANNDNSDHTQKKDNLKLVFMFSGQGSQYLNMGRDLYLEYSSFKSAFDNCCNLLLKYTDIDFRTIIFSDNKEGVDKLLQTNITQPLLFVFEYALVKLWENFGVTPSAMIGHSIGELVCACISGVFTLEEALFLVVERGKIMYAQPSGKMLSVSLPVNEISTFLDDNIEIALINSPTLCVVAGPQEHIDHLQSKFTSMNIDCRPIHTSHAFHSSLMNGAVEPFTSLFTSIQPKEPLLPFISNVSGCWITPDEAKDPAYWGRHLRNSVNFSDGIGCLLDNNYRYFLEIGPGSSLATFVTSIATHWGSKHKESVDQKITTITSVRHSKRDINDLSFFLNSIGQLWQSGVDIEWTRLYPEEKRLRIPLPTYPFEGKRHWIDPIAHPFCGIGIRYDSQIVFDNLTPKVSSELDKSIEQTQNTLSKTDAPYNVDAKKIITIIWEELLGLDSIDPSSSFFELGGDSIMAVQMFSKIQKKTGINLPIATLLTTPTIDGLSSKLNMQFKSTIQESIKQKSLPLQDTQIPFSYIVPIKSSGTRTPFFCVHCIGGNVLNYNAFVPFLDKEQPLYGLQCRGLDGVEKPFTTMQLMAEHYVQELRLIQPHGPYLLGGGSMGGLIAFEMAQQIAKMNDSVALLVMLDSCCPKLVENTPTTLTGNTESPKNKRNLFSRVHHSIQCRISDFYKLTVCKYYQVRAKAIPHELRYWYIEHKHIGLTTTYQPESYNGLITMFRATQNKSCSDPYRGWKSISKGGMTFFDFECDHDNIVEQVEIAKKLNDVLNTQSQQLGVENSRSRCSTIEP